MGSPFNVLTETDWFRSILLSTINGVSFGALLMTSNLIIPIESYYSRSVSRAATLGSVKMGWVMFFGLLFAIVSRIFSSPKEDKDEDEDENATFHFICVLLFFGFLLWTIRAVVVGLLDPSQHVFYALFTLMIVGGEIHVWSVISIKRIQFKVENVNQI